MKKIIIPLFICLFLGFQTQSSAQNYFESKDYEPELKHLVLAHPTVYNLKTFVNLLEKNLVDLPDTRIVGVFHYKEQFDYSESEKYLDTCKNLHTEIFLHQLTDSISAGELYQSNALSDDFEMIFDNSEGTVFFGGPDLPPVTYGEKTHFLTSIYDPYRHYFELSFLFHLAGGKQDPDFHNFMKERKNYLVYGFCLGMQTMNVAAGGTMVQDIPTEIYGTAFAENILELENDKLHRNYNNHLYIDESLLSGSFHSIEPLENTLIHELAGENSAPLVYSNHHQCVDELGQHYSVMARSMDGRIVEALEHTEYSNVIGVQFHPEAMRLYNPEIRFRMNPGDPLQTGKNVLIENNSYLFHKAYWKDFSRRFKDLN